MPERSLRASASSFRFGKLAGALALVVASLIPGSRVASAQAGILTLSTDWLITGLDPDGCLNHAENVYRQASFTYIRKQNGAVLSQYGNNYSDIMCLPNKVVVFVVAGDQAASLTTTIKQLFVSLPAQ